MKMSDDFVRLKSERERERVIGENMVYDDN